MALDVKALIQEELLAEAKNFDKLNAKVGKLTGINIEGKTFTTNTNGNPSLVIVYYNEQGEELAMVHQRKPNGKYTRGAIMLNGVSTYLLSPKEYTLKDALDDLKNNTTIKGIQATQ